MKFLDKFKSIFNKVEDMLFVECECISCLTETDNSDDFLLCNKCKSGLQKISAPVFNVLDLVVRENKHSENKKKINYYFNSLISLYLYNDISSQIIKNFKYSNQITSSKYIARLMTENAEYFKGVDYLTFVPISSSKYSTRGYNQAEELAKDISKITKIPVIDLLFKDNGSVNQAGLNRIDRINNLKDCFHLKNAEDDFKKVSGKTVMIIDDIYTTGTTINRCSEQIVKLKPKEIIAMTFAKTGEEV